MNVLIIEDESRAANRMIRLLNEIDSSLNIVANLESVKEGVAYLNVHTPDLIISDVQLADGLSFEIYKTIPPKCPIIFTTAYDQYAIQAFETNGIDYLLKPIEQERLDKALQKLKRLASENKSENKAQFNLEQLLEISLNQSKKKAYKARFMIKVGDKIKAIPVSEIDAFYSMEKGTYLHTKAGRNYVLEYSLEQLINMVNPNDFFKINRKFIIHIDAPQEIIAHSNSRLKLVLKGFENESIIVAREKVRQFKAWLDQ